MLFQWQEYFACRRKCNLQCEVGAEKIGCWDYVSYLLFLDLCSHSSQIVPLKYEDKTPTIAQCITIHFYRRYILRSKCLKENDMEHGVP